MCVPMMLSTSITSIQFYVLKASLCVRERKGLSVQVLPHEVAVNRETNSSVHALFMLIGEEGPGSTMRLVTLPP